MCGIVTNVDPNPLNQRAVHMSAKRLGLATSKSEIEDLLEVVHWAS